MLALNAIRENIRAFLRIPENITAGLPTISASLPTASLGGHSPEMSFTRSALAAPSASAAPVAAAAPKFRRAPVDGEGLTAYQRKIQFEARLKTEFNFHGRLEAAGLDTKARRKVLADFDKYVASHPAAKATPAPATVDNEGRVPLETPPADDPENAPGLDSVLSQLLDLLQELKKLVATTDDDTAETVAALGHFAAGRKLTASRALMELTQKMCKRPKLTPEARIARGFSGQAGVRSIQAALRPGPRLAPSARTALAAPTSIAARPVSASTKIARGFNAQPEISALNGFLHRSPSATSPAPAASVPPAVASPSDRLAKISAIQAKIKSIDIEQKKQFSNARHSEHLKLKAQLSSLRPQ